MIFKVFKIRKMIREAKENPGKFTAGEIRDFLLGSLIVPFILIIALLAVFFILGFTSLFFIGPFLFFKIIFFVSFLIFIPILFLLFAFWHILRRIISNSVNKSIKVTSKNI